MTSKLQKNSINKDLIEKTHHQTFESLKQEEEDGCEFWSARKLSKALEYYEYRNFLPVVERAKEACKNSVHAISTISLTCTKWSR